MTKHVTPEFSLVVHPSAIGGGGERACYEREASRAECDALAQRFGLRALESFRATMSLRRLRRGEGVRLNGHIVARVVQSCVVTLDPVVADVDERFETLLLEESAYTGETADPEEDIDLYSGDAVDIGEIAAEELALSLDPYPRSPQAAGRDGAAAADSESDDAKERKTTGYRPFEALAGLKRSK